MTDMPIILFNGKRQIHAGPQLLFQDQPVQPFPIIRHEEIALYFDFIQKSWPQVASLRPPTPRPGFFVPQDQRPAAPKPGFFNH